MRFDIISAVPELLTGLLGYSIPKRACDKGLAEIFIHNLHDYGFGKHKQIDDYPFGGGAGMVLMAEPLSKVIEELLAARKYDQVIYMTPDGTSLKQSLSNKLSLGENLLIICGHYKGIDQRVRDLYVSMEISLGDFVLSGGEVAAAALVDSVIRLIPNVLGDGESALGDSFQDDLLAPPLYTRPELFQGLSVPPVLTSGNHSKISEWKHAQSLERTLKMRPDLLGLKEE
ncbi:MAG: tRNA (guanosine(37)-N1)-methyltransferase TrmD [Bacteroidetes bacterium]|nr:tRNA (guanosine(37)-N1)-methyltransferase TrmD [Bacteroidota bacterium]MSP58531.1 tRNA (guanosine(37)-N1)-methyltransferase TrmD [Flavobacteriaceae bacterium]PHX92840.1 MAG: tRNA (guanosine(37)-N1)-methyltransferase TrmD [Flavobacteriales bacterium]